MLTTSSNASMESSPGGRPAGAVVAPAEAIYASARATARCVITPNTGMGAVGWITISP